jgi:MoxR-like ATPase
MDEILSNNYLKYTGRVQPQQGEQDRGGQLLYPYLPDDALIEAINLAIYLKRPLLIKGEPGCGKTRLAAAVAYELHLPYEHWHIKSTSRAHDGLCTYDTVGRLRDAQLAASGRIKDESISRMDDPSSYVRWGPLGRAFQNSQRTVVLIDEIDKADIDFPNDLLLEIDERRFLIEETGQEIRANKPPIVFITSNDEKDLPDAFLRRCLFHYIEFPRYERLVEIVKLHFPDAPEDLVRNAVGRFHKLRKKMEEDKGEVGKKVSTSELIDWFHVLNSYPLDEAFAKVDGKLPISVLLKSWDDHARYLGLIDSRG